MQGDIVVVLFLLFCCFVCRFDQTQNAFIAAFYAKMTDGGRPCIVLYMPLGTDFCGSVVGFSATGLSVGLLATYFCGRFLYNRHLSGPFGNILL